MIHIYYQGSAIHICLKNIETKNERLEDIFIKTRIAVKSETKNAQSPIDYGSIDGRFYIAGNTDEKIIPKSAEEEVFWNSIENSTDIEDFENYLARCERKEFTCLYKALAELKIYRIRKNNAPLAWKNFQETAKNALEYFSLCSSFSEGLCKVGNGYGIFGLINERGKEIVPLKYSSIDSFSEQLAVVRDDSKYGFIDKSGARSFSKTSFGKITPTEFPIETNFKVLVILQTSNEI